MNHTPVFLPEVVEIFRPRTGKRYIDATLGRGGHANALAGAGAQVLAIEKDHDSLESVKTSLDSTIIAVEGWFGDIEKISQAHTFTPVDGILFDLGLSMWQYVDSQRGFSYTQGVDQLDMRFDPQQEVTAADIINSFSQQQLYELFARNAQELNSRAIAQAIVRASSLKPIKTVADFLAVLRDVPGGKDEGLHRRLFQALHMEVNDELGQIAKGLAGARSCLKADGVIIVISFHQMHEWAVKKFAREHEVPMKKYPIKRTLLPFERSATLRVSAYAKA
jgi:16S rRNA (cytosine1402-N4)-methyltransferase